MIIKKSDTINIKNLLSAKANLTSRLKLLPYDGSPEIKYIGNKKFLYVRKRVLGKLTSKYVDVYSKELHNLLLNNANEAKNIRKQIRSIEKQLVNLGYISDELSLDVIKNIELAYANMKSNIYDQAVLEGVATSFPQTSEIIDNGIVNGVSVNDVQKIINLKHAWEFILDRDVITCKSDYSLLCYIAKLVNEGLKFDGGKIRNIGVRIGGTSYIPPIPNEQSVKNSISKITNSRTNVVDQAIQLCLYCMRTQVFSDGNKRTGILFANHYLISHGKGILIIPKKNVSMFKKLLVKYYESNDADKISKFLKEKCYQNV